ncbi:MAG: precorrin-2 C(20)-methyltransferase [Desulfuromonadaceae bacterium]|nr:precorrin-2 C(20)-methyltransferase [Desulfuromonadaceae bacterium]
MTAARTGTFYGVGVGPGDPELLTLKAVRVLSHSDCIYVPSSHLSTQNYVAEVVKSHASPTCESVPVTFSLADNSTQRQHHWHATAQQICARLQAGQNVAFVTLGDPLLYSTYIYLLRALQDISPTAKVETVPGISAFSAAAALTNSPLGEGLHPLTVIPAANDLEQIRTLLAMGGGVVLMKIGPLLAQIIALIEQADALPRSVFVARAGLPEQHIETDLLRLRHAPPKTGNLAVIIVQARRK